MSKFTKNSGFNRQEAVMGQFRKDRLSKIENYSSFYKNHTDLIFRLKI